MSSFHFAIIGLGAIARKWTEDVQRYLPKAQIYAVCSRSAEHAQDFAAQYGITHHFNSIDNLLQLPGIDAVYIANPHPDHYAAICSCIERGIAVICEKPMAMHAWQVQDVVSKARSRHVFLMEAIWTRFIPGFQTALALIEQGTIGDVHTITADFGFKADPNGKPRIWRKELGAGSLLDIGIYPVLLTQYLLGVPDQVKATASFTDQGIDESCAMVLSWKNSQQALLHCSLRASTPTEARIYGSNGSIYLHPKFHHPVGFDLSIGSETTTIAIPIEGHGYHYEAAAAMECIKSGGIEHPLVSHQFSLDLAETLGRIMVEIGLEYV
jgi:predicted dehydrogenase